jgi:glycosyltransferase involved in cell wall biosynthesis
MKTPVSADLYVLIPYYNDWHGLIQSIQSISYRHNKYALLIIDDGSEVPVEHAQLLPHIPPELFVKIIRMPTNEGITKALNAGLQWLHSVQGYKYVARLDCGDICAVDRFYRQIDFLEKHPTIGLVGSWCVFKDTDTGSSYLYKTPTRHQEIRRGMHFRNLFIHPTVMWRAEQMDKEMYPFEFPHAEDYGLFYKIIQTANSAVLPEILVTCRINPKGLSLQHRREQLQSRIKVVKQYGENKLLTALGILRLKLLLLIPYPFILKIKRMLYRIE